MPCNMMEGACYDSDTASLQRRVERLERVANDQADSLCFLRELVYRMLNGSAKGADPEFMGLYMRLGERVQKHREFDRRDGRGA